MLSKKSEDQEYNLVSYILSMGIGSIVYLATHYSVKSNFIIISSLNAIPFYLLLSYGIVLTLAGLLITKLDIVSPKNWLTLQERLWIIFGGAIATLLLLSAI